MRVGYVKSFDGIRAIAFLLVFFSHAGLQDVIPGAFGVCVFFFLSGFLITSLLRFEWQETKTISIKHFYFRRACRILPPLYAVLAAALILQALQIPYREVTKEAVFSVLFYYFNYQAILLPHLAAITPGLGALWSLMVEEHFYLIFPLAFLLMLRSGLSKKAQGITLTLMCALALVWRGVLIYYFHTSLTHIPRWTLHATDARFDSILWGCILAIVANPWAGDKNPWLERHRTLLAAAGCVILVGCLLIRDPHFRETIRYTLQGVGLLPVFYYVVGAGPESPLSRMLAWSPLRWLGYVSYSMYLIHDVARSIFWYYLPHHPVVATALAFAASALWSETVRRTLEIPFKRIAHRTRERAPVTTSAPA